MQEICLFIWMRNESDNLLYTDIGKHIAAEK